MPTSIALIVPPVHTVARPSLGLSSLQASLVAAGHLTRTHYLNLTFAESVGPDLNEWLCIEADFQWLIGEWIFARLVRPRPAASLDDRYFRDVVGEVPAGLEAAVRRARDQAGEFVRLAVDEVLSERTSVVGVTTSFQQTCAALALAAEVKRRSPETLVCLGGGNCEGPMGAALAENFPQLDAVFSGEGEVAFPRFLESRAGATERRGHHGCRLVEAEPVPDLETLEVPQFSDYFAALARTSFADKVTPGLLVEGSRGCWWGERQQCVYCGVNGAHLGFRAKGSARVFEEMETLSRRWSTPRIEAVDNVLSPRVMNPVFDELAERDEEVQLFFEVRPDLGQEGLRRAACGGVTWVQAGIESLDDRCLERMNKGTHGLGNIRFLRDCREVGVRPLWILLHGIPGEPADAFVHMASLAPYLHHLPPPERCYPMRLDRFSPCFERAAEFGIEDVRPVAAYEHVFGVDADVRADLAYFFEGTAPEAPRELVGMLEDAVRAWRRAFFAHQPILEVRDEGGRWRVTDTRPVALDHVFELEDLEKRVLDAFRQRRVLGLTLGRLAQQYGAFAVDAVFRGLLARGLVVTDGDAAVSVVCEAGRRVHPAERFDEFPGGAYTP